MRRLRYFGVKVLKAWSSGTLLQKARRFAVTALKRPIEVLIAYHRLPAADRRLNVRAACADHRGDSRHRRSDPEHIRRIRAAYRLSKQAQSGAAPPFRIRGLWAEWISVNFGRLTAALGAEDPQTLAGLLENLLREQFTNGLGGFEHYLRSRSLLGHCYVKYLWSAYRDRLRAVGVSQHDVDVPFVGNPVGVLLDGKVLPIEALRHAYHAAEMCELLRGVPAPICVEIGGGIGGQAFQTVQRAGGRISKYVLFDLPEVAAISSYYLLSAFPGKRVRLFGEGPVSVSADQEYDIAVFPHFAVTTLPPQSVDLFYNSCSFSEMDGASSREYLATVERACRRYFLHDNHDVVLRFRGSDGSTSSNVIGSELVPDPARFKRVFKKPRVHGLPEDRSFVHFEYLYERL